MPPAASPRASRITWTVSVALSAALATSSGCSGGNSAAGGTAGMATAGTGTAKGGTPNGGSSSAGGAIAGGGATGGSGASAANGGRGGTGGSATGGSGGTGGGASGSSAAGGSTTSGAGGAMTGGSGGASPTDTPQAADLGFGTNIGNTFDNTTQWEVGWGQPLVTREYVDGMASRGIKTVRVPVAWNTYSTNGTINASHFARVKEVVGWIEAAGMYPIVNIHWDGGWIFNEGTADQFKLTAATKSRFASYWTQLASGFNEVGHHLILEGLNEEGRFYVDGDQSKAPDYAALNELNQLFVTTVRAQGGFNKTRALLIAGFGTDIDLTCVDAFNRPNDPAGPGKLFLSLHYYNPYTFAGLEDVASWGSPATTWGTSAEKATLEALFAKAAAFSVKKDLPVIVGEFAVTRGTKYPREPASRTLWMQSVAKAATSNHMVPVLWDTGSEISRVDGAFSPEFQAAFDSVK